MQDSLLHLCLKSFYNFSNYLKQFVPDKVDILTASHIVNYYSGGVVMDS
jgi:hypothetical protein